jgi:type I restriction enzyme S subunit
VDTAIKGTRAAIDDVSEFKRALVQNFFYSALGETAYADRPTKELPTGWSLEPTAALISNDPKNGVSPKATTQPPGTPTFSIAAIRDGRIDLLNPNNLKYAKVPDKIAYKFRISTGDILIVRGNANPDLVGKAGRVTEFPEGCIYPDITKRVVFRRDGERPVLPEFAVLTWNHPVVHNQVLRRAKTSNGTLKINNRDVKQIILPVPPIKQQQEIVRLASAVDAKADALNKKRKAFEELKKSLMRDLLTGSVRVDPALFKKRRQP